MNLHIVKIIMDRGSAFVLMVIVVMVRKKVKTSNTATLSIKKSNFCKFCINIDECLEELDNCGDNAICTDLPGTWNCTCEVGYHDFDRELNGGRVDS